MTQAASNDRTPVGRGSRPALAQRWYGPIVTPRRRWVEQVLRRAGRAVPIDPSGPRAGLASAVAAGVAWTYGDRVDRKALGVGCVALEVANHYVFAGLPAGPAELLGGLDGAGLKRSIDRLLLERSALLERMADRVVSGSLGRHPLPEAVLFLRAAAALGVVVGQVDDATHGALDRVMTWLGVGLEPACDGQAWTGAFSALGVVPERMEVGTGLRTAAAGLPDSAFRERLEALQPEPLPPRAVAGWVPMRAPLSPHPRIDDPVERALDAVVADGAPPLTDAARFLLRSGGKRLRPKVVVASCVAVGGQPCQAIPAAATVEWLHLASLVLDDIMDEASLRRGFPTLHVATDRPFAVGVFLWLLERIRVAAGLLPVAVRDSVRRAAEQLAVGQGNELVQTRCGETETEAYHRVIAGKTASLFSCAAQVGATVGGADSHLRVALGRYGHELGLAFQIIDDVLDYTGEPSTFGKLPGTDLRAGKPTLPFLLLRDQLQGRRREQLLDALGKEGGHQEVLGWMREAGVLETARMKAEVHVRRALEAVSELPDRDGLEAIARQVVERDR